MSEHTFKPVLTETFIASGTVVVSRFVKPTGAQCDTKGERAVGVSFDGATDGQSLGVITMGTALVEAGEGLAPRRQSHNERLWQGRPGSWRRVHQRHCSPGPAGRRRPCGGRARRSDVVHVGVYHNDNDNHNDHNDHGNHVIDA